MPQTIFLDHSEQDVQLQVLGDLYNPPNPVDCSLRVVDESWFEQDLPVDELSLAGICWFEMLNERS